MNNKYLEKRLEEFEERLKEFVPTNTEQDIYLLAEDIKSFLSTSIAQAIAQDRERVRGEIEKMNNDVYGSYEEFARQGSNRCKQRVLSSLDKPLADKE